MIKTEIPIRTGTWDVTRPGCLEAGSVAHCGASLAGEFIRSPTYTDIASQWTEGRAVWNKAAAGVLAATCTVEAALPFALLGLDCDNGGEFLNHHLLTYLHGRQPPVAFTRSRPYHSDDNAHVEQKTWKKCYAPARTANERLMDPGVLGRRARRDLRERYESLDTRAWTPSS